MIASTIGAFASRIEAHEIPPSVVVRLFVRIEPSTIRVLVRAPLEALRDVDLPVRDSIGHLDLARMQPLLHDAAQTWLADGVIVHGGSGSHTGRLVRERVSLPSDRSFDNWNTALRHLGGDSIATATMLPWRQALVDAELEYPRAAGDDDLSIEPTLARLGVRTTTVLHLVDADGSARLLQYSGDPGRIDLDPRWYSVGARFIASGFGHILDGIDHLLFLFCLVIPFRKLRPLIGVVTAFTVAHSITLSAAALGHVPDGLWFPPLVELLIAASILYMALENIVGARLERRWVMAFVFGLIHGFGFSFALRESLQFAGEHLAVSILTFNIGVELGQIAVLVIAIAVLELLYRRVIAERMGIIIMSAIIAHAAWHWSADRWDALRRYEVAISAAWLTALLGLVLAVGAYRIIRGAAERWGSQLAAARDNLPS